MEQRKKRKKITGPEPDKLVTQLQPDSFLAESYRKICLNLMGHDEEKELGRVIMMTSSVPCEGVSLTTANIAVVLAQSGQRTLLLEVNFRHPTQEQTFRDFLPGIPHAYLCDFLSDGTKPEPQELLPSLWAVFSGRRLGPLQYYFLGKHLRHLLKQYRTEYDFILMDMPAALPVPETASLAGIVDEIILVVAADRVTPREAMAARARLEKAGGKIKGAILNSVRHSSDSGYKDYEYYNTDYD